MEDDIKRIYDRLNQTMGYLMAQSAMTRTLLGMIALNSQDWRGTLDNFRVMTEYTIKTLEWNGSAADGEAVRSEALEHLLKGLDDLHAALLQPEIERGISDPSIHPNSE